MVKEQKPDIHISETLIRNRWIWHLGFWVLFALSRAVPYYSTIMYYERPILVFMICLDFLFAAFVYATLYWYKYCRDRQAWVLYFLSGFVAWALFLVLMANITIFFMGAKPHMKDVFADDIVVGSGTRYFFTFLTLSFAKYIKDQFFAQYAEQKQRALQVSTELENLKAQIAPHFLFNTMHNFYGLAVQKSDKLPDLMIRLSELLRYSLYETQLKTVSLAQEISYLSNYIALEEIRLEDDLDLHLQIDHTHAAQLQIAPLLLVVFVENAFKHAKKVSDAPISIHIKLEANADAKLFFSIENNCAEITKDTPQTTGIGIKNVKKRLEALYPAPLHQLIIQPSNHKFAVHLQMQIMRKDD
jgi:sensor histidine kinase YesM